MKSEGREQGKSGFACAFNGTIDTQKHCVLSRTETATIEHPEDQTVIPRTDVTYGQLDKVLRAFGFSNLLYERRGKAVQYNHKATGAVIQLPLFPEEDCVFDYHLAHVRTMLDGFGIADPSLFESKLKKVG
jgi:hypothetical protein